MFYRLSIAAFAASLVCACNTPGGLTPAQTAQVFCALAADGVTVTAVFANQSVASKASAVAPVACDAGTQIGQIVGASK